jgi:hypothetical protein
LLAFIFRFQNIFLRQRWGKMLIRFHGVKTPGLPAEGMATYLSPLWGFYSL